MTSVEFRRYLNLLRRWAWLIVALPVVAGAVSYLVSDQLPKIYVSEGQVLVRALPPPTATSGPSEPLNNPTLALLMTEPPVMQQVIADLGLKTNPGALAGQIRVTSDPVISILHVTVSDNNPQRAEAIANDTMKVFIAQLKADQEREAGRALDLLTVVAPATAPGAATSPQPRTNALIAAAAGLMLAIAIAVLFEFLDQTLRSEAEVLTSTGLQILGHVPFVKARKQVRGELDAPGSDGAAEAYRTLRTNLQFASVDQDLKSIVVTSSIRGEGKSRLAANLAVALAGTGRRTLVIDGDLRRPRLHTIFGRVGNVGLAELLIDEAKEEQAIKPIEGIPNLWLLPAGEMPFDPTILLGSQKTRALIQRLGASVDHVVIDSPPVSAVADPLILAAQATVTMLVVEVGVTSRSQLTRTREALERARANVVGVVISKVKSGSSDGYGYGYGPGKVRATPAAGDNITAIPRESGRRSS